MVRTTLRYGEVGRFLRDILRCSYLSRVVVPKLLTSGDLGNHSYPKDLRNLTESLWFVCDVLDAFGKNVFDTSELLSFLDGYYRKPGNLYEWKETLVGAIYLAWSWLFSEEVLEEVNRFLGACDGLAYRILGLGEDL